MKQSAWSKLKRRIDALLRAAEREDGFTIMEIMIVLLIITILATGVTVAVIPQLNKAKNRTTCVRRAAVMSAAEMYYAETGECPTIDELKDSLKGEPVDAWDQEFKVECTSDDEISVVSSGKDKNFGTEDDLDDESCRNVTKKD
jgi:prepilin-type N-terminal cleavage/methylation domain-containing protein